MVLLQTFHARFSVPHPLNSFDGRCGRRDGRDDGQSCLKRCASDRQFVEARDLAERRVHDDIDLTVLDMVDDVGTAFVHFEHPCHGNIVFRKEGSRAARCIDREAELLKT